MLMTIHRCARLCVNISNTNCTTLANVRNFALSVACRSHDGSHNIVVHRNDNTENRQQSIGFSGEASLGYVPLRMSHTICVRERLPAGAAAVLINQTHTCNDLFLPIDSAEKCLFEAMMEISPLPTLL